MMAMVEQRKSLPQAVPSSIYNRGKKWISQLKVLPSRENRSLLRWVEEAAQCSGITDSCQPLPKTDGFVGRDVLLTLVPP